MNWIDVIEKVYVDQILIENWWLDTVDCKQSFWKVLQMTFIVITYFQCLQNDSRTDGFDWLAGGWD